MNNKKKLLIICPFPIGVAAGQRLKYEQYFKYWKEDGYNISVSSFSDKNLWNIQYKKNFYILKIFGTLRGYLRRLKNIFHLNKYEIIYVFMWVTPFGSSLFERVFRMFSKRIIYDFDDAIFIKNAEKNNISNNPITKIFKNSSKYKYLIKYANHVVVSSPYHVNFCKEKNIYSKCTYIPCSLDVDRFTPLLNKKNNKIPVIGWTGTFSSINYLDTLREIFIELSLKYKFKIIIIGNFEYNIDNLDVEVIKWSEKNEVEDLQKIDIGVYPIIESEWALGKGALKAMQYMSVAVPTVATDFGTSKNVINNNKNGLLVKSKSEWIEALTLLLEDNDLRLKIGKAGRETIVQKYSHNAIFNKYLEVLNGEIY